MKNFNNSAPIIPSDQMGGFKIGVHFSVFENELNALLNDGKIEARIETPSFAVFDLKNIVLYYSISTGNLMKIATGVKYKGKLMEVLGIGDKLELLLQLGYTLLYDDFDNVIFIKGIKGVCIEINSRITSLKNIQNTKVESIIIYDSILDNDGTYFNEFDVINPPSM